MRIITHSCRKCGTIVAVNVLESNRTMKCPGLGCDSVLRFEELPQEEREYFLEHIEEYQL